MAGGAARWAALDRLFTHPLSLDQNFERALAAFFTMKSYDQRDWVRRVVELEERKAGADPSEFPARPAHFGPRLGGPSEAADCVPGTRMFERFFGFTDHGRHFYALVAFGPAAPKATRDEAWGVLDSLKVEAR